MIVIIYDRGWQDITITSVSKYLKIHDMLNPQTPRSL